MRFAPLAFALLALGAGSAVAQTLPPTPPGVLSDQAKAQIAQIEAMGKQAASGPTPMTTAQQRALSENLQTMFGTRQQKTHPVTIREDVIAGVPVRIIAPKGGAKPGAVLLNLHGGGFMIDSGSLSENIPIADLTGLEVVAVRYRLAPENPFPAARDDALAVYKALLKRYPAKRIVVYGTSAGAVLGPQLIMAVKAAKLPMPAALGIFSGAGDLSKLGDSEALFDPQGAVGQTSRKALLGDRNLDSPEISPLRGDLSGFPPTLCLSSSRDLLLSGTANLCRALDTAGVRTRFVVFDGLPHAYWSYIDAPETDETFRIMARFMCTELRDACAGNPKR